jgi:flagellar FliL protein
MKKIIMLVMALALVGGGGFALYKGVNQKAEAAVEGKGEAGKHADKGKEKEGDAHVEFVQLDPLMLPVMGDDGVSQMISLVVTLEVADAPTMEKVKKLSPKLTDAYIQDMYGVLNQKAAMPGGVVQVGLIKQRLQKATVGVLGDGVVSNILLQHLQQSPI